MAANGVSVVFQGDDHIWVKQELDGVVYQTLSEPADPNYTLYNEDAFDSDVEVYEAVRGKYQSERNEAYHQLDLRIDKDWIFDYWIFTAYLDIQNVYYHANEELWHYSYDYSSKTAIKGLPIQPSFGIRGAF
jgi:hypothetical protein